MEILAICSPHFVPLGKGRDRKTLFFRVKQQKMQSQRRDPVKKCFQIETFPNTNEILRTLYLFSQDCTFLKAGRLENSCLPHYFGNFPFTSLLGVSFRKESGPEKSGQELKSTYLLSSTTYLQLHI